MFNTLAPIQSNPVAKDHPLTRGLVGWWLCVPNRMQRSVFVDLGSNTALNVQGGAAWSGANSRPGGLGAIALNGVDSSLTSSSPAFNVDNDLTISAWVRPGPQDAQAIVHWGVTAPGERRSLSLWNNSGGGLKTFFSGGFAAANVGGARVLDNNWHHLTVTLSGGNSARVYVDGTLDGSGTVTLNAFTYSGLTIGNNDFNERASGLVDSIQIYNRPLTNVEVRQLYDESLRGYPQLLRRARPPIELLVSRGGATGFRPYWAASSPILGTSIY